MRHSERLAPRRVASATAADFNRPRFVGAAGAMPGAPDPANAKKPRRRGGVKVGSLVMIVAEPSRRSAIQLEKKSPAG